MRRFSKAAVCGLVLLASTANQQAPVPLTPAGKWSLEYTASSCVASRAFGPSETPVTVAFRTVPLSQLVEVSVILQSATPAEGKATLTIGDTKIEEAYYRTVDHPTLKSRVTTLSIDQNVFDQLPSATTMTIALAKQPIIIVPTAGAKALSKALEACEADLKTRWGLSILPTGSVPAEPLTSDNWITFNDYPPDAINAKQEGTSLIGWSVGIDGKVLNCRTLVSSGSSSLDNAACLAITSRGKYKPAMNSAGEAIVSDKIRRVVWKLPQNWTPVIMAPR